MTINEAVELVDRMKPNQYDHVTKVRWLSKLDGMIFWEVIATHEGSTLTQFDGYEEADPDTVLLVPYPYDEDTVIPTLFRRPSVLWGAEIAQTSLRSTLFRR